MVQGGSKRKGAANAEKDGAERSWSSYKSVLDVRLSSPADVVDLPEAPVHQYLEEVPLGMRGGPGDALAQANDSPCVRQTQSLQRVLSSSSGEKACRALLWLAVGGVFGHFPAEGLTPFRTVLGENWYLLSLALAEEAGVDRHLQDWVNASLPFVLAQAIFRMLCDGFTEDRKVFLSHPDKLVCKLTQVVHFELTGFQMTADTVRKERRRLLQKHIFKHPNTNQREFLRGQRRQEMLESQNTNVGDQPLRFGEEEAHPLEETQLDHVMQGVLESRNQPRFVRKDTQSFTSPVRTGVPQELRVDRYAHMSEQGAEMLERQLEEFALILGETDEEEESAEIEKTALEHLSVPGTPMSPHPRSPWAGGGDTSPTVGLGPGSQQLHLPPGVPDAGGASGSRRPSVSFRDAIQSDDEGSDTGLPPMSPTTPSPLSPKPAEKFRKSLSMGGRRNSVTALAKFSMAKAQSRDRKAKEEKARKLRQEHLLRKICVDKLPAELCEREFSTTWVSPCQMALMKGEDRSCLTKTSAESHVIKMETRGMLVRPLSMPALRAKGTEQRPGVNETMTVSGGSGGNAKEEGSQAGASVTKSRAAHGRANSCVGANLMDSNALPRVFSAGGGLLGSTATRLWATKAETISLEPPPRLSAKVIMRRLEDQAKASKQMSFALYMKEYDIFTNMLKKTVDESRLRDEEDACLRKTAINGPPKRRLAPNDLHLKPGPKPHGATA